MDSDKHVHLCIRILHLLASNCAQLGAVQPPKAVQLHMLTDIIDEVSKSKWPEQHLRHVIYKSVNIEALKLATAAPPASQRSPCLEFPFAHSIKETRLFNVKTYEISCVGVGQGQAYCPQTQQGGIHIPQSCMCSNSSSLHDLHRYVRCDHGTMQSDCKDTAAHG